IQVLQPERDLSYPTLFPVMFNFENVPTQAPTVNGLKFVEQPVDSGTATLDLSIEVAERDGRLSGQFVYNTDLFEASTIARMVAHFQTLLVALAANPQQTIAGLPLLTESERRQLLVDWNTTETDYPREETIHSLFEQQVQRTPDAIALFMQDEQGQQVTYSQLNRKANQLAHYLQSLGVGPGMRVAVCLD